MISRTRKPVQLYVLASVLGFGAVAIVVVIFAYQYNDISQKNILVTEIAKGLIQFISIAMVGTLIKFQFDKYLEEQKRTNETQIHRQEKRAALNNFRMDKIRRLVQVTNTIRKVPVLIDANRSSKTYNEQMRAVLDASLEIGLIRQEIGAVSPNDANLVFRNWLGIDTHLSKMEESLVVGVQKDFRLNNKKISELQIEAEKDRQLQKNVWQAIGEIPSIREILEEDTTTREPSFIEKYLKHYREVIKLIVPAQIDG